MTIIKTATVNGFGVRIVKADEDCYWVEENSSGYYEEGRELQTLADAELEFSELCKVLGDTPNWELQAKYDEEHGTVNGYDPRMEAYEAWRNEY